MEHNSNSNSNGRKSYSSKHKDEREPMDESERSDHLAKSNRYSSRPHAEEDADELERQLEGIDSVINNCQNLLIKGYSESHPYVDPENQTQTLNEDNDMDEELSEVSDFELTKSYGHADTANTNNNNSHSNVRSDSHQNSQKPANLPSYPYPRPNPMYSHLIPNMQNNEQWNRTNNVVEDATAEKHVRFRDDISVQSVECEYSCKAKGIIDDTLRDDLSDEDDFADRTSDDSRSDNGQEQQHDPDSQTFGRTPHQPHNPQTLLTFNSSGKNFFKSDKIVYDEEEFKIVSDERDDIEDEEEGDQDGGEPYDSKRYQEQGEDRVDHHSRERGHTFTNDDNSKYSIFDSETENLLKFKTQNTDKYPTSTQDHQFTNTHLRNLNNNTTDQNIPNTDTIINKKMNADSDSVIPSSYKPDEFKELLNIRNNKLQHPVYNQSDYGHKQADPLHGRPLDPHVQNTNIYSFPDFPEFSGKHGTSSSSSANVTSGNAKYNVLPTKTLPVNLSNPNSTRFSNQSTPNPLEDYTNYDHDYMRHTPNSNYNMQLNMNMHKKDNGSIHTLDAHLNPFPNQSQLADSESHSNSQYKVNFNPHQNMQQFNSNSKSNSNSKESPGRSPFQNKSPVRNTLQMQNNIHYVDQVRTGSANNTSANLSPSKTNLATHHTNATSNSYFDQIFESLQKTREDLKGLNINVDSHGPQGLYSEREMRAHSEQVVVNSNANRKIVPHSMPSFNVKGGVSNKISNHVQPHSELSYNNHQYSRLSSGQGQGQGQGNTFNNGMPGKAVGVGQPLNVQNVQFNKGGNVEISKMKDNLHSIMNDINSLKELKGNHSLTKDNHNSTRY